jgi:hypothetical protein
LLTSILTGGRGRTRGFDDTDGPIRGYERLVGDPSNVRFAHFVEILHLVKEFTPIGVPGLIQSQLEGQAFIAVQAA